ncbi:MAG: hypothetical protein WCP62_11175, partial [Planctomycetota bacterium]
MLDRRSLFRGTLLGLLVAPIFAGTADRLFAQSDSVNTEIVDKIKQEGMERSKVMETISYLTDVSGPRLTGAPETKAAGEWAKKRLEEYGLENAHLEPWGPFGRGWSLQSYRANVVGPNFFSLIAYPKAWTPSTPTTVRGEPIYLDANTPEELEKYRGKLGRAIVLISPPRELKPWFDPPGARQTDSELLNLANAEVGGARRRRPPGVEPGTPAGGVNPSGSANTPGNTQSAPAATPAAATPAAPNSDPQPPRRNNEGRGPGPASNLTTDKWQLAYDEGAAVVLEPGRGDGGTVFVASATMPRRADSQRELRSPGEGGPMSRGARPWTVDSPAILPQMVVAAEHYNRLVRMVQKGVMPQLEIDIESTYHDGDANCFNIIAEIPGSDLRDEIVMIGAHFDS